MLTVGSDPLYDTRIPICICNKAIECAYFRGMQFKVLQNRLVTQTLVMKMGKSESDSCL